MSGVTKATLSGWARACGFELAGVAAAQPHADHARFVAWAEAGFAGRMGYLTDFRAELRQRPQALLPGARSIICVGKLYQTRQGQQEGGEPVSRYARAEDYHRTLRRGLEALNQKLAAAAGAGYASKLCVDTAPLLERSYARQAGLGWIGRNTCLIHEGAGSWFFLGALLTTLDLEPDTPPPNRCGSCRRCIDACPTAAIVPQGDGWAVDARRCISYLTIELRGPIDEALRPAMGGHVFGCDVCQEVCPWNRKPAQTEDPAFAPRPIPPLEELAALSEAAFKTLFADSPIARARRTGLQRNLAIAMGNSPNPRYAPALQALTASPNEPAAEAARWALTRTTPPPKPRP